MIVKSRHRRLLQRQLKEKFLIQTSKADITMNLKNEWNSERVLRITLDVTENEVRDKDVAEWIENYMNRIEESTKTATAKKEK